VMPVCSAPATAWGLGGSLKMWIWGIIRWVHWICLVQQCCAMCSFVNART
jgi:hypothetical protein